MLRSHRHLDAYVVIYAVSDRESFDDAVEILHELKKDKQQDEAVVLVANKSDMVRNREVREEGNVPHFIYTILSSGCYL